MKQKINNIGIVILLCVFFMFYIITSALLDNYHIDNKVKSIPETTINNNYENEKSIVNNLYQNVRILYDVINNKFKVDQNNQIIIGEIIYKKITNFDEVMINFTDNGIKKYINDLNKYFAYTNNEYYLAGNLVSYQTYYFRGEETNIYITNAKDYEIEGIIYEKWKTNNKNTIATIKIIKENNNWLIDKIDILSSE